MVERRRGNDFPALAGNYFQNNFLLPPASDPSVCALNSVSHAQKEEAKRLGNSTQGFWEGGGRRKTEVRLDKTKAHYSKMCALSKKNQAIISYGEFMQFAPLIIKVLSSQL